MNIKDLHSIYFLGIGGIGMSALARYFFAKGINVSGYDKTPTTLTQQLIDEGIPVHFEDNIDKIPADIDMVVYTPAIPSTNKEYINLIENGYAIKKRSEVLGLITKNAFTIAVAGTHGKTSTTSLIAHILKECNIDITAFVGGISKNYNSNFIFSEKDNIVIVEADEYDRSFLTLHPDIAVITSVDADHLDIYGSKKYLIESFSLFAKQIKSNGKLIIKNNLLLTDRGNSKQFIYSYNDMSNFCSSNVRINNGKNVFDIIWQDKEIIRDISFEIAGKHNIENAVAASAVALLMGVDKIKIKKALESYKGVKRRFDYIINTKNIVFIDDYAHHPEELKAIISSVKELYPTRKITGIFQPHLYSRTRDFVDEFARSLELLDEIILLDIYPARELPIDGINSSMLLNKIKNRNKQLYTKSELIDKLNKQSIEVLLTLGAGDIDQLVEPIKEILLKRIRSN